MLLRQTLLYLPAQVLGPLFQLISAFAWTHVLAPEDMGTFALVSATQELAFAACLMWFSLYTVRYFDNGADPADMAAFHATECAVLIGASVVMALAAGLLPPWPGAGLAGPLPWSAIAFVVTRSIVSYLADRVRAEGDTLAYTVLQTSGPVAGFAIALLLTRILPANAATVLAGYTVAQAASLVFAARRLTFSLRPQDGTLAILEKAARYGLPLFVGALLVWVANNAVRFIVEWREGIAAVGLVTVGWSLGLRASQFAAMLTTAAAFPLAVRKTREGGMAAGQAQLIDNGVLLLLALAPATAGLYVIGPSLIAAIVAEPYRAVTTAVLPMALVTGALRGLRIHFANQVFLLHEAPLAPVLNDGLDAVLTVVLGGLGLAIGGVTGCVSGVMAGSVVTLATGAFAARRTYGFAFPLRDLARIGVATGAMAAAVWVAAPPANGWALAGAMALGGLVYGGAIAALYPAAARRAARLLQGFAATVDLTFFAMARPRAATKDKT